MEILITIIVVAWLIYMTHKVENLPTNTKHFEIDERERIAAQIEYEEKMKDIYYIDYFAMFPNDRKEAFKHFWIDTQNYDKPMRCIEFLSDDDYIEYKMYADAYRTEWLTEQYPNGIIISGNNPNIIFHCGCLGCKSQRLHGIDRCKGCCYFRGRGGKSLFIEGEEADTIEDWDEFIKNVT